MKPGAFWQSSGMNWKSIALATGIGCTTLLYMWYLRDQKDRFLEVERKRSIGKASIGGTFELVDSEGKTVKSEDFLGQWVLIYFGFTHCPDVCPDEIEKMVLIVDKLGNFFQSFFSSYSQLNLFENSIKIITVPLFIRNFLKQFSFVSDRNLSPTFGLNHLFISINKKYWSTETSTT